MDSATRNDVVDALRSVVNSLEIEVGSQRSLVVAPVQPALLLWALETIVSQRLEIARLREDSESLMSMFEKFAR